VNPSEPPVLLTADCAGLRDRTLTVRRAYGHAGALSIPTVMIPLAVAAWRWGPPMALLPLRQAESALLLAAICLAGSWLHEALHLLGWKLAARIGRNAVRLGWSAGALAPCALVEVAVPARAYRFGVALPGLLLGLAPLLAGLTCSSPWLLWCGILFSVAALGDALVLLRLRGVPGWHLVRDHPSRARCTVEPEAAPAKRR